MTQPYNVIHAAGECWSIIYPAILPQPKLPHFEQSEAENYTVNSRRVEVIHLTSEKMNFLHCKNIIFGGTCINGVNLADEGWVILSLKQTWVNNSRKKYIPISTSV